MTVNIVGFSQLTRTPAVNLQIVFGAGSQSASAQIDKVCVYGFSANGAGSDSTLQNGQLFGPDTTKQVSTTGQCVSYFGQNSELTKFASTFYKINQQNPLYFVPVADTGTYSGVKIATSGTVTYANTINVFVNTTLIQVPVNAGDSVSDTTISTKIAAAVNAARAEFIAQTAASGFVVLAAGSPGNRNTLSVQVSLAVSDVAFVITLTTGSIATSPTGTFTAAQVATSSVAYTGNGTLPNTAGDLKDALETVTGSNMFYHKVLLPSFDEASSNWTNTVSKFSAHITAQALPKVGVRTYGYTGASMTSTNAVDPTYTLMTNNSVGTKAINNARMEVIWSPNSDANMSEILGTFVGAVSLFEQNLDQPYALNFCAFGSTEDTAPYWTLSQPRNRWTENAAKIEEALGSGITVVGYSNGSSYIVRRSTSKCVDVSGNADQRIADPHKVLIMDKLSQDIIAVLKQAMKGKVLVDAPLDSNDSIPQNSVAVTFIKGAIFKILDDYANRSLIQSVATTKSAAIFARSKTRADTIEIQLPISTIDIAAIANVELDQIA